MGAAIVGRLGWLVLLLAVIWVVEILNWATGYAINRWVGLDPRSIGGLLGIPLMPVLHGSITHAVANTVPLIIFGALMGLSAPIRLLPASLIIVFGGGLLVWLFGREALHVGASGLIFGWFGFLVARGFFESNMLYLAISIGVALFYGTMVWGVLPLDRQVSWEAHLFGALAGVASAFVLKKEA
jgi:membrane associated rhomboid family serine protease